MLTDNEILKMDNVSVEDAADYIGKARSFVLQGLQVGELPFGVGIKMPGGRYSYSISPGLLVAYKRGTMSVCVGKAKT